ncbi:MAG: LacI family transcriptional regulator [Proteobacteria bacterium]|nr:LacI family transcriptional regulator [Pseudomonadota bacterium]
MKKKATRKQVAEEAGVSEATVSRVFNNPVSVNSVKVERVRAVAESLDYAPDKFASALRRKGSSVILFLERREEGGYQWTRIRYYNAFFAEIVRAVAKEAEKSMYHFHLKTVDSDREIAELARSGICDGIIGFSFDDRSSARILAESGLPYVCCHHTEGLEGLNRVATDNHAGGLLQAGELRKSGHTKPVYITGALEETFSHRERLRGFREGFAGVSFQVLETDPSIQGGKEIARKLIADIKNEQIDALGVVNDLTAIGVIQELMAAGVRIPEDVSVIGYDNLPATIALPFRLTSIELSLRDIYRKAFWSLIELIRGNRADYCQITPIVYSGESIRVRTG